MEGHSAFIVNDTLAEVPEFKTNIRETDQQLIGIVTDRFSIVQNQEAVFIDELLGEGIRYETVGRLQNGYKVYLLAKFPEKYTSQESELALSDSPKYISFTWN